MTILFSNLT